MSIEEYDILDESFDICKKCGIGKDLVDNEGEIICTDCLFYEKSMEDFSESF